MTLQERIDQSTQQFNELTNQRDNINQELLKLQGEYRILNELLDGEKAKDAKPNKKATVIEAVPESEIV